MPRIMHTFEGWVERLEHKPLSFLVDQLSISGYNGKAHDDAVAFLVRKKKAAGEVVVVPRPDLKRVLPRGEDEEDYVIEQVPSGPRGQKERVKVPRSVYTS